MHLVFSLFQEDPSFFAHVDTRTDGGLLRNDLASIFVDNIKIVMGLLLVGRIFYNSYILIASFMSTWRCEAHGEGCGPDAKR